MKYAYRYGTELFRQELTAAAMALELYDLTLQEIECWRMFGIRADWVMDELVIQAP